MDAADILFGEIAVSGGYLTHEQLVECLMTQSRRPSKRIGELARELGFIDDAQLAEILSEQKDRGIAPPPKRRAPDVDRSRRRMSPSMEVLLNDYVDDPSAASPLPPSRAAEVDGAVRKLARERRRDSSSPRAVPPARGNASLDALLEGYMDDAAASDPANDPRSDAASRLTEDAPHVPRSEALHAAEPARAHEPAHASTRAAKPPPPKAPPVAGTPKGPPPAALPAGTPKGPPPAAPPAPPARVAASVAAPAPAPAATAPPEAPARPRPAKPPRPAPAAAAREPETPVVEKPPPSVTGRLTDTVAVRPQDLTAGAQLAENIITQAQKQGASDVHLHTGAPPLLRVHGELVALGDRALDDELTTQVIASLTNDAQWATFTRCGELDFAIALRSGGRARVNAYRQQRGPDVVLRLVGPRPPTLSELSLPDDLGNFIDNATGMVLCTGPSGCGKSTTMAALVALVAERRAGHVITIEDPIEYIFDSSARSMINQRQLGDHTRSCARALRAALREDPDVIAITELRDRETIALAMTAAETGHLVLGTLHTGDAAQTINRIINAFPASQQSQIRTMLSESLRVVISQRLVARRGGGRVPALEVLVVNAAVANMIRDGKTHQLPSAMQVGRAHGMRVLDDSLERLVAEQHIDVEVARRFATKPERFGGGARS